MPVNQNQFQQQVVPQGGIYFDIVRDEVAAYNYLISPGNTVYLYDPNQKRFYEKTFSGMQVYDLVAQQVQQPQQQIPIQNQNNLSRDEILQLIREELSNYNPHIPKKDRRSQQA